MVAHGASRGWQRWGESSRVAAEEIGGGSVAIAPDGASAVCTLSPRLTPWATLSRRSAAAFAGVRPKLLGAWFDPV